MYHLGKGRNFRQNPVRTIQITAKSKFHFRSDKDKDKDNMPNITHVK